MMADELELDATLEEVATEELEDLTLDDEELTTELELLTTDDVAQALTTPYGAG